MWNITSAQVQQFLDNGGSANWVRGQADGRDSAVAEGRSHGCERIATDGEGDVRNIDSTATTYRATRAIAGRRAAATKCARCQARDVTKAEAQTSVMVASALLSMAQRR